MSYNWVNAYNWQTPDINKWMNVYPIDQVGVLASASYGLRLLTREYSGASIRVRDDTNTETNIGFDSYGDLDTTGLTNWLERNLLGNIPLGVDTNADGISDGWGTNDNSITTVTRSIEESAQKITITNANTASASATVQKPSGLNVIAGNEITFTVKYKTDNMYFRCAISALPSTASLNTITSLESEGLYTTLTINATIPASQTGIQIFLAARAKNIGDTGSVWFKDATLTISNQSAYVTTWYDQSGNDNHATQLTASNQPRIVNAGVIDIDAAGNPTLVFDGTNDCLSISDDVSLQLTEQVSINAVTNTSNGATGGYVFARNGSSGAEGQYGLLWSVNNRYDMYLNGGSLDNSGDNTAPTTTEKIATSIYNKITAEVFVNGVSDGGSSYTSSLNNRTNTFIGARSDSADGSTQATYYNGKISEITLFETALTSSQRQKLEQSQSKYYGL